MDQTTVQVYGVFFVLATVLLVYTARYFQRRGKRRPQRRMDFPGRVAEWRSRSIEANRPLHLGLGGAVVGEDRTAIALASAEFFYHVIEGVQAGDVAPIISTGAASSVPLAQDTARRAWSGGGHLSRAQWYPPDLAYAAAVTAVTQEDEPAAHIWAGSFGSELALMIDSAERRGQGSLAASDRLEGQAVAYALADEYLLGEELFAAAGYVSEDGRAQADAIVLDVWRGLVIMVLGVAVLLEAVRRLPGLNWALVAAAAAILLVFVLLFNRNRNRGR